MCTAGVNASSLAGTVYVSGCTVSQNWKKPLYRQKTTFSGKIAWKYVKSVYTSILKQEKLFGLTLSDMLIQSFYKRMPEIESSKIHADFVAMLRHVPAIDIIDK